MVLGVVAFALALTLSIALHELGHLATAKRYGMKATRYFIGFGPTLWSTRRGETEYGVKALPLGGFVKIVGMTPIEELDTADDEARAFWKRPARQRAVVLGAGSFMHFLLAFLLLAFAFAAVGEPVQSTTIGEVSACLEQNEDGTCRAGAAESPAKRAGLRPGDEVVALDGRPVEDWSEDLAARVREHPAGPATVTVRRDGRTLDVTVDVVRRTVEGPDGKPAERGQIGLLPKQVNDRIGVPAALARATSEMGRGFVATGEALVALPASIPKLAREAFGEGDRSIDGVSGIVGVARVAGQATAAGEIWTFLMLIVGLNIFVGVFNLLPLLPLDGGHLAILGFENARSWLARRRGRREPGRVDLRRLLPATYAFLVLLVSLQLLVLYADIANPISDPFLR